MDPKEMERFKAILTDQVDRLLNQAKISKSELATENTRETEYVDRASIHAAQALRLRFRTRESRLLNKLRLALERVENGTYGECEICGEPISIQRLEARPVTTKCISCKEQEELMEAISK